MKTARPLFDGMPESLQDALQNDDDIGRRMVWDLTAIGVYVNRIADLLGRRIGVTGSQWLLIMAVDGLGEGEGVSVRDVAALLNVDGSFVSAQSKILEEQGILRRSQSTEDKRLVLLAVTELAKQRLRVLDSAKSAIETHVCGELEDQSLQELSDSLITMRRRLGRAMLLVAAGE
ncbi:MarR family winged helix-turn-helix transcriptional regulator [Rhodopseudomonas boonkerdii]|uniref:MarR family winged helix-turn-helix transcriptional regulator n=1 Tax=Rhodopseudomonas boonkerdii TaxID=475937 RepID=UPI001E63AF84|nr:MarR family transcriptional regulator [Rhodopseudomonas boonkerdii]